MSRKTL